MNINDYNIAQSPPPFWQPPAPKKSPVKKIVFIVTLCLVIILAISIVIILATPNGPMQEVEQIYKDWGGSGEFVTMRTLSNSPLVKTSLLFEDSLFSSEITVMGTVSTSGFILMAGITFTEDTYTWRIEAYYDGDKYLNGNSGMQSITYSGKLSPTFFDKNTKLTITESESSDFVPNDFRNMILKHGAQIMAQALDDLNTLMRIYGEYDVWDLGFEQF